MHKAESLIHVVAIRRRQGATVMQRSRINLFFLKLAQWGMRFRMEVAVAKIFVANVFAEPPGVRRCDSGRDPLTHRSMDPRPMKFNPWIQWIRGSMDPWIHGFKDPWVCGSISFIVK